MCLTNHNCGLVGVSIFCDNERQIRNRSVCSWSPLFFYFQNLCAFSARFYNSRPSPTPGQGRVGATLAVALGIWRSPWQGFAPTPWQGFGGRPGSLSTSHFYVISSDYVLILLLNHMKA